MVIIAQRIYNNLPIRLCTFGYISVFISSSSWTSPEGAEFYVKYVADRNGYRVVDSNAIPATAAGVRANGAQGSFSSEEDISFDDSDENDSFFDDRK